MYHQCTHVPPVHTCTTSAHGAVSYARNSSNSTQDCTGSAAIDLFGVLVVNHSSTHCDAICGRFTCSQRSAAQACLRVCASVAPACVRQCRKTPPHRETVQQEACASPAHCAACLQCLTNPSPRPPSCLTNASVMPPQALTNAFPSHHQCLTKAAAMSRQCLNKASPTPLQALTNPSPIAMSHQCLSNIFASVMRVTLNGVLCVSLSLSLPLSLSLLICLCRARKRDTGTPAPLLSELATAASWSKSCMAKELQG